MGTIIPIMRTISPSLSNALFSKVRQCVLALLYGQPDRSFHTNEIIRLTHSGTGAVQRELEKLAAVGLITPQSIGNQKHYRNVAEYEGYFEIDEQLLKDLLTATQTLLARVSSLK